MKHTIMASLVVLAVVVVPQVQAQSVSLVTLGDSLTAGDGDSGGGGGYPARLLTMIQVEHSASTLLNLAVSGFTSDDLINVELDPAVAALEAAPSGNRTIALVWVGSNDLFGLYNYVCDEEYGNDYPACENATFGYFSENINTILSALSATGAELFIALLDDQSKRPVMTDPALRSSSFDQISDTDVARMSVQVGRYNSEIATQAAAHGATTVDFFNTSIFEDWATLDSDGNHPNAAGYDEIAAIWFRALGGGTTQLFRLTVTRSGLGSGTVTSDPAGIHCNIDCSHDFEAGLEVRLVAYANTGSVFAGWGGDCSGTGDCTLTMDAHHTVDATFDGLPVFDNHSIVPVVVHSPGVGGTNWRSSVVGLNTSGADAEMNLVLQTASRTWSQSAVLPSGASIEWQDIVVDLFGVSPSASTAGALHITADEPVWITSRTFNQADTGTYGQYLPALTNDDALTDSDIGYLLTLKGIGFRSNVGFINLAADSCDVRISLFDADGSAIGSPKTISIPAGLWVQKNDVFSFTGAAAQTLAYATVELESREGAFWAYASIVDDATGDATTIPVLRE